jgi:Fic family protein
MSYPEYRPYPLELLTPQFDSEITDLIIDLDHLRKKEIRTATHPVVFRQLVELFHIVEGLASARIEGNNTQLLEFLEVDSWHGSSSSEGLKEIRNLENTLAYIDSVIDRREIDTSFILEIHQRIMEGLKPPPMGDGDIRSGMFRQEEVGIAKSAHLPPPPWEIDNLMNELLAFLDQEHPPKFDLIKSAMFHHRFVWIHPFANGNGRAVRMLTYAILIKQGFRVNTKRILNPASAFCLDRNQYYKSLAEADSGKQDGILRWCFYMLNGLRTEIDKIDRLSDAHYLNKKIFIPAIEFSYQKKFLSEVEYRILKMTVERQRIQAADLKEIFISKLPQEISRQINRLRKSNLLLPEHPQARKYVININNKLPRMGFLNALDSEGFLP